MKEIFQALSGVKGFSREHGEMRKVIFLLEELSMKAFLEGYLPRLIPDLDFLCIQHEGKQDLEKSIPRKFRAWPGAAFVDCLLVISLPASDTTEYPHGSSHSGADDAEVGGQRGREALDRLRNVVGRVESSWRPASAEEGFEIVRRRLFEPMADPVQFKNRDVVARAFADLYRTQQAEFPPECRDADYEKRIKAAYPIHPEIFDRLYTDWSTLVKFQRTRGVLRLMAAVIHSLWEKGDKNPLIMPANISIDDPRVQFELTRYLSDNWVPVIEKDVDGPSPAISICRGSKPRWC
jgi:hypothetical protein